MMNWNTHLLYSNLLIYIQQLYLRYRWCDAAHPFWLFYWQWKKYKASLIHEFITGYYRSQPKIGYNTFGYRDPIDQFQDALMQKLLYQIIKPTFTHIISPACHHLKGSGVIKNLTHKITDALSTVSVLTTTP